MLQIMLEYLGIAFEVYVTRGALWKLPPPAWDELGILLGCRPQRGTDKCMILTNV
jgi:hypothetical protein